MQVDRILGFFGTFALASVSTFVVTSGRYGDVSHPTRLIGAVVVLIALHGVRFLRLWISREVVLNLAFLSYALLTLLWADHVKIAMEILPAFVTFTLVLILFSALTVYHDVRAVLCGIFAGFLAAAAMYSLTTGFPLSYPDDFSYNTIAGMYLFGLFITIVAGAYFRLTVLPLAFSGVLLALLAATTSIKTNLGFALGVVASGLFYFRFSMRNAVRSAVVIALIASGIAYGVTSNQALVDKVQHGFERVSTGFEVLTSREGDTKGIGLEKREGWKREGLKGWFVNPVFGYGIEGFRGDFGITSHSTPIDLLYNSGVIGCGLFYGLLASVAWRLLTARDAHGRSVRARIATFLIAYSFMSLSGIVYSESLLAIIVAVSSGMILRLERTTDSAPKWKKRLFPEPGAPVPKTG